MVVIPFCTSCIFCRRLPCCSAVAKRVVLNSPSFDFAVSRAVASLELLAELYLPYVKVGGKFLAMKSVDSAAEVEGAGRAVSKLGGRLLPAADYAIPGAGVVHRVIGIEKIAPTPGNFPRRWANMQKKPL